MNQAQSKLIGFDHIVLTVRDLKRSIRFYSDCFAMTPCEFKPGRWGLHFANQKINLHEEKKPVDSLVKNPVPGSSDFCLLSKEPVDEIKHRLQASGIEILAGPSTRTGATGPIKSIYLYDPDDNLIEVANLI